MNKAMTVQDHAEYLQRYTAVSLQFGKIYRKRLRLQRAMLRRLFKTANLLIEQEAHICDTTVMIK